jgi:hypothetical protein
MSGGRGITKLPVNFYGQFTDPETIILLTDACLNLVEYHSNKVKLHQVKMSEIYLIHPVLYMTTNQFHMTKKKL